jgi:hypothetical protein
MSVIRIIKKGLKEVIHTEEAQLQPLYYTTIDGTSTGIKAEDVSLAIAGNKVSIKKIYVGLGSPSKVKITSIDTDKDKGAITGTPSFQAGINETPVKEIISDPDNPTEIDIYY